MTLSLNPPFLRAAAKTPLYPLENVEKVG